MLIGKLDTTNLSSAAVGDIRFIRQEIIENSFIRISLFTYFLDSLVRMSGFNM